MRGKVQKNNNNKALHINLDVFKLKQVKNFFNREVIDLLEELIPSNVKYYKYCPIASLKGEGTLSSLKDIIYDQSQNFTLRKLEKYIIMYCSKNYSL